MSQKSAFFLDIEIKAVGDVQLHHLYSGKQPGRVSCDGGDIIGQAV